MLLGLIIKVLFALIEFIIDLLPNMSSLGESLSNVDISGFMTFLAYGFAIFPFSLFMIFISNVLFWLGVQMVWAIIEWIYKKIPGVK